MISLNEAEIYTYSKFLFIVTDVTDQQYCIHQFFRFYTHQASKFSSNHLCITILDSFEIYGKN